MSLEEFVKNRRELPSFGLHGTKASNVDGILKMSDLTFGEFFKGHYFYCGQKERELPDKVYAERLKASILEGNKEATILLVNTNKEIRDGLGNYIDILGTSYYLVNNAVHYNSFFGCQTFPVGCDPMVRTREGKNVVELRALIWPEFKLETIERDILSTLDLVYQNLVEIKSSTK